MEGLGKDASEKDAGRELVSKGHNPAVECLPCQIIGTRITHW